MRNGALCLVQPVHTAPLLWFSRLSTMPETVLFNPWTRHQLICHQVTTLQNLSWKKKTKPKPPTGQEAQEWTLEFFMTQHTKIFHYIQHGCSEDFTEKQELTAFTTPSHSHNHSVSNKHVQKMAKHCSEQLLIFVPFFSFGYSLAVVLICVLLETVLVSPNHFHRVDIQIKPINVVTIYRSNITLVQHLGNSSFNRKIIKVY